MQMKAKNIIYIFIAACTLLLSACVDEKLETGAPDKENCMGVYFLEEQENVKTHTLTYGEDQKSLEFIVRRVDNTTEAYVDFTVEAYTIIKDETYTDTSYREVAQRVDELFEFGEIYFKEGQRETTLKVWFENIEIGKSYECAVTITDPEYVSSYNAAASSITFGVQMFEWEYLGKATYRDALFSDMFLWDGRYLETEVDIYERTDEEGKGCYRLKDIYSAAYVARLVEGDEAFNDDPEGLTEDYEDYITKDTYIIINATDSSKVFIPAQKTGFTDSSMGEIMIATDTPEVWGTSSNMLYGTLSKDGVITFPKNGLLISLAQYFYFSNTSGKARIVLPGGKSEDYILELEAGEINEDNEIPVKFKPAKSVKKVKYSVFEGQVGGLEVDKKIEEINSDSASENGVVEIEVTEEQTFAIRLDSESKTGLYTLIACTYDEAGQYKEYASAVLGYVKPGEDKKVKIDCEVILSDYYASEKEDEDYNAQNSFEYRVWGDDITHAMFNYYSLSYYNSYKEQIEKELKKAGSIDNSTLKTLNERGLSGVVGNNLKPGTEYIFVIYAGNGYHNVYHTLKFKTEGEEDLMQKSFWYKDLKTETHSVEDYTGCSWVPVSTDVFDADAKGRTIRGKGRKVKFTYADGKMTASGIFPALNAKLKSGKIQKDPDIEFAFEDGYLYTIENKFDNLTVKDSTHLVPSMRVETEFLPKLGSISGSGYFHADYDVKEDGKKVQRFDMLKAGFVHEDIIAFTDNNTENTFWALLMGGYITQQKEQGVEGEDGYKPWKGYLATFIGESHGDLILVREGSPLLSTVEESDSDSVVNDGEKLNSVTESNRVDMPAIGSILKNLKPADIAHDKVGFTAVEIDGLRKTDDRKPLLTTKEGVRIKAIVK